MRRFLIRTAGFYLCAAMAVYYCTSAIAQQKAYSAHADIVNAQGQKIGTATILPSSSGVRINVEVSQLLPGAHGIHIHTVGKCEGPAFTSAGAHFNPTSKKTRKGQSRGTTRWRLVEYRSGDRWHRKNIALRPERYPCSGANSLFNEAGTALVIHEKQDDYKTDPAANSGARIACGVIRATAP